ncbi:lycopene cyclase family protein [Polaromonas sp.]|uniref:lycopene cyclase family protein n=1 Tax=Polaromonas sp. TaxID=1869339 RepID=UPI0013B74103|nr:lycopene cyclase family protein [Polaromonas sp.]NDP62823.1 NAD(P)-binding protein [Polaromonas sp.]
MAFDIVIVGGGLSGLALAAELAQAEFSKLRVLVLEQRKSYVRDRTWSYWKTPNNVAHRYSHLERHQWSQWCVRQGVRIHQQASPTVTKDGKDAKGACYCTLDADAFYSAAQCAISQSAHVELRLGTSVRQITGGDTPSVETSEGEVIHAAWVFDARPPAQTTANSLVQQFVGYEIKTGSDVFDPTTVELMHFQPSTAGLHFFYVLPYSPRNALIETTWISPASFKPNFGAELQQFTASFFGSAAYEVVYEEKGALNLSLRATTPNNALHVAPLGRGAGTLRASTGYAFLETLAHAAQIAASLKSHASMEKLNHWVPVAFKRRALDEWMDTVFLQVLERDWSKSSWYFMQLFERLDADTMVAFLSGRASWRQRLLVAGALPTLPFAAQALSIGIDRAPRFSGDRR